MTRCQHCRRAVQLRSRRLCERCYYDPAIRNLYPRMFDPGEELSEAELEAIIEQQRPTMPRDSEPGDGQRVLNSAHWGRAAVPVMPAARRVIRKQAKR